MRLDELKDVNITEKRLAQLNDRGLMDTIDVCYLPPRKYYYYEKKSELSEENNGRFVRIEGKLIKKYIRLDAGCEALIKEAFETMDLSARGAHRVLKLARTIADLDGQDNIGRIHLAEAIQLNNSEIMN